MWTINADGSGARLVTPGWVPFDAAVSPDCRRVAWIGDRGTGSGQEDLFVADADGSHRLRLTSDPTDEWFPAWSADGKRIVFVDRPTIQVIGADRTGRLGGGVASDGPVRDGRQRVRRSSGGSRAVRRLLPDVATAPA